MNIMYRDSFLRAGVFRLWAFAGNSFGHVLRHASASVERSSGVQ
jgi:hypothetical protein